MRAVKDMKYINSLYEELRGYLQMLGISPKSTATYWMRESGIELSVDTFSVGFRKIGENKKVGTRIFFEPTKGTALSIVTSEGVRGFDNIVSGPEIIECIWAGSSWPHMEIRWTGVNTGRNRAGDLQYLGINYFDGKRKLFYSKEPASGQYVISNMSGLDPADIGLPETFEEIRYLFGYPVACSRKISFDEEVQRLVEESGLEELKIVVLECLKTGKIQLRD